MIGETKLFSSGPRALFATLGSCAVVAALVVACGSDGSTFENGQPEGGALTDGSFVENPDATKPDLYANDPPSEWCGPETGAVEPPPPIGGTEECPDDKNKPGCGCNQFGQTAPCWTGLRKHRNLGVCKDGVATCIQQTENTGVWGACEGEVLPTPGAIGAEGCGCFSAGLWNIANTSPCLRTANGSTYYAYSTVSDEALGCGNGGPPVSAEGVAPPGIWSSNTLKVDCAGTFHLCYRIRAGNYGAPSANDCILGEVCTDAQYDVANVEQKLPDLATWAGKDPVCAKKWEVDTPENVSPGYGEMIVKGQTVRCDAIDDGNGNEFVFHRVQYCPRMCRDAANAGAPECVACQLAGSGEF